MVITFDLQGRDRKQLVKAIADITGARPVYKFMPTCAFEIDFFTVTKEGTLEFSDRSDTEIVEQVLDGLAERGFAVISSYYDNGESAMETDEDLPTETPTEPDTAVVIEVEEVSEKADTTEHGATLPETATVTETEEVSEETEKTADMATLPDTAVVIEVEEVSEKADTTEHGATLADTAENTETEEVSEEVETTAETPTQPDTVAVTETEEVSEEAETTADSATQPDTEPTAESETVDRFSISMRRDFFDEAMFSKLDRLIESKSELFQMAFKTDDLSYEKSDDRVTFAWFPWTGDSDEGVAYSTFIDMLTKHLKEQKRVNASKTQTDNPKFAMRVFLIRLGMVGNEYKAARKILLRNLEGSSAFRKGAPHNEDTE